MRGRSRAARRSATNTRHTHRFALGRGGVARPDVAPALGLAGEGGAAGGLEAAAAEPVPSSHAEQHAQEGNVLIERRPDTNQKKRKSNDIFLQAPAPPLRQEPDLLCCSVDLTYLRLSACFTHHNVKFGFLLHQVSSHFPYILYMSDPSELIHPNVLHHNTHQHIEKTGTFTSFYSWVPSTGA